MNVKLIVKDAKGNTVEVEKDIVQMIRDLQKLANEATGLPDGAVPAYVAEEKPDDTPSNYVLMKVNSVSPKS